jgi:hypothetical protein
MISNKKRLILLIALLALLAAGCAKIQLQQNVPTSPQASYDQLPR